jgi:1-acyl-sn-glycerol-3-phosphate acyltransferase
MGFRLAHRYPVPVDVLFDLLTDEKHVEAMWAAVGSRNIRFADPESPPGVRQIRAEREIPTQAPGSLRRFVSERTTIEQTEEWRVHGEQCQGLFRADPRGVPVSTQGTMVLRADEGGCVLEITAGAKSSVPMFGSRLSQLAERQVAHELEGMYAFTLTQLDAPLPAEAEPRAEASRLRASTPPTQPRHDEAELYSLTALRRALAPARLWFSPRLRDPQNVPSEGPALLAGNRGLLGVLDLPLLLTELELSTGRRARVVEDPIALGLPAWGTVLRRLGAVSARHTRRLLEAGELVIVFPGGLRERQKRRGERYRLFWSDAGDWLAAACELGCPIVPFASVGPDDAFDVVLDGVELSRWPLGPLFEALLPPGLVRVGTVPPLVRGLGPTWIPRPERFYFGFAPPVASAGAGEPERRALATQVERAVERMLGQLLIERLNDPGRRPLGRFGS